MQAQYHQRWHCSGLFLNVHLQFSISVASESATLERNMKTYPPTQCFQPDPQMASCRVLVRCLTVCHQRSMRDHFWTSAPFTTCRTPFWDFKKGRCIFKWKMVCASSLEKKRYHSFCFATNSTPALGGSFWFVIRGRPITQRASESMTTTSGMRVHFHIRSGWFCEAFWALVVSQKEGRVSHLQAPRLWNTVLVHTAYVQPSLTAFEAFAKQLLHDLHSKRTGSPSTTQTRIFPLSQLLCTEHVAEEPSCTQKQRKPTTPNTRSPLNITVVLDLRRTGWQI